MIFGIFLQQAYTDSFEANGYDALILPGLGITAPPHGKVELS